MPDMLVHLLKLPPLEPCLAEMHVQDIVIRRANSFEITPVQQYIAAHFSQGWADEVVPCFSRQPVSLFIALSQGRIVGFSACEATRRNFFGPTGVTPELRGRGIGRALLLAALHYLHDYGYAYAIIGGVGPSDFYSRVVDAILIPNSTPGIYTDLLSKSAIDP